jgi:CRP/FNR family transcriptional regulator, cyclic AMP receptor protein
MADLDPARLTERVLRLGRIPLFNRLTTAEIELLANAGREAVYAVRTLLVPADERASAVYIPLTGRLRAVRDGQPVPGDPIRDFYGGTSLLSDSVIAADVVAEPGTVLFVLDRDAMLALLEEHGDLQRSLLWIFSRRVIELRGTELVTSGTRVDIGHRGLPSSDLLSRIRLLRDALGLGSRSLPVLAQLARAALVRRTAAGRAVWNAAAGPASAVVIVQGAVDVLQKDMIEGRMSPGEGIGMVETVAEAPQVYVGKAVEDTVTVEVSCAEMQEAMEDHDDFCQDLTRVIALELHRRMFGELVVAHA